MEVEVEIDISKIYLVLAYNYRRYLDWCREVGIDPHGRGAKYIHLPMQLLGYKPENIVLVYLDGWWVDKSHNYYEAICNQSKRHEALGAEILNPWEV